MAALSMHIPDALRPFQQELADALAIPVLAKWNDGETYHTAEQATAIGDVLVNAIHPDLLPAAIAYIYREKMKTRDAIVWGKAGKAGAKLEFFAGHDYVIEINWTNWRTLSAMQRVALVDHVLTMCVPDADDEGKRRWALRSYDVQEFGEVVNRWGLYRKELAVFSDAITHSKQLGMFDGGRD